MLPEERVMGPRVKEEEEEQLIKPFATKDDRTGRKIYGTWADLLLKENVESGIKSCGFHFPSEVQYSVIPEIVHSSRRDILCQAKSGTGKTNVFLISILEMLRREETGEYKLSQCIVIGNTRQLAHQIYLAMLKLAKDFVFPPLNIGVYFGGLSIWDNQFQLRNKNTQPHVIIGTPGRLMQLIRNKKILTKNVDVLVVDECDVFVSDNSFLEDLKSMLRRMPQKVQLLMFTATITQQTREKCLALMKRDRKVIQLSPQNEWKIDNLQHFYVEVPEEEKGERLALLLDNLPFNQAIIFVNSKDMARQLVRILKDAFFKPLCIHSQIPQDRRIEIYDQFKHNLTPFLIATDVFGRGIDIEHLNLVINYEFPFEEETYLHRAGRAGRFGRKGKCLSFVRPRGKGSDWVRLQSVMKRYDLKVRELPKKVNAFEF